MTHPGPVLPKITQLVSGWTGGLHQSSQRLERSLGPGLPPFAPRPAQAWLGEGLAQPAMHIIDTLSDAPGKLLRPEPSPAWAQAGCRLRAGGGGAGGPAPT